MDEYADLTADGLKPGVVRHIQKLEVFQWWHGVWDYFKAEVIHGELRHFVQPEYRG